MLYSWDSNLIDVVLRHAECELDGVDAAEHAQQEPVLQRVHDDAAQQAHLHI